MINITKVDFSSKRRGRTPYLYPVVNAEWYFTPDKKTINTIRLTNKGRKLFLPTSIISIHSIYYRKETNKNVNGIRSEYSYLVYTDGKDFFQLQYYDLINHIDRSGMFEMCSIIRDLTPVYEVMAFYSL